LRYNRSTIKININTSVVLKFIFLYTRDFLIYHLDMERTLVKTWVFRDWWIQTAWCTLTWTSLWDLKERVMSSMDWRIGHPTLLSIWRREPTRSLMTLTRGRKINWRSVVSSLEHNYGRSLSVVRCRASVVSSLQLLIYRPFNSSHWILTN